MTKAEVLEIAGPPTDIDTIPSFDVDNGELNVVWQYGDAKQDGNQRVEFSENIVSKEVIAAGPRFDELCKAFERGEIKIEELLSCIKELNREAYK
jgi:hypothetical protein